MNRPAHSSAGLSASMDEFYMLQAIEEGERARLLSPPNPWVGCVIVKDGRVISKGHTQPPGKPHAEIMAINAANESLEGATAYVSLEPCAHQGRTPPCTKSIIRAGIKRVVVAVEDPDPLVHGKGVAELIRAGIQIAIGVCAEKAQHSLRAYLHHRQTGRPYCIIKAAISIDGRAAAKDGSSQWITSEEARLDVHRLRAASQGIMVGSGTALTDLPSLTARGVPLPASPPLRILYDRRGRVPATGSLFDCRLAPTLVITSERCPIDRQEEWTKSGAGVEIFKDDAPFESVLTNLGSKGIIQLMIEGGPALHGYILQQKMCQEMVVYTGNVLLGESGLPAFAGLDIASIAAAPRLSLVDVQIFGDTVKKVYFITQGTE